MEPSRGLCSELIAPSKEELLRKLLPGKFSSDTCDSKTEEALKKFPAKSGIESLKNILTENAKTPILDDSFSLWDEVYGVTETESKGGNNEENNEMDDEMDDK